MPQTYIVKTGQINTPPKAQIKPEGAQITIGDLHGNAMKLIYFLLEQGVIDLSDALYKELNDIYKKPLEGEKALNKNDIQRFNEIIDGLVIKHKPMVRLIGDELADRGENDYYVLKIIDKLVKEKIPVEILMSNHSIEFLQAREKSNINKEGYKVSTLTGGNYLINVGYIAHARSLIQMQEAIEKKLISHEEIDALTKNYLPLIKFISYSLNEERTEITLYSHAGIDLVPIKALANKLELTFNDSTLESLAQSIDAINEKMSQIIINGELSDMLDNDILHAGYEQTLLVPQNHPLEYMMWNRNYYNLKRHPNPNGYKINYVHGHDAGIKKTHVFNIDSSFGKITAQDHTKQTYYVLASNDVIAPQNTARNTLAREDSIKKIDEEFISACSNDSNETNSNSPDSKLFPCPKWSKKKHALLSDKQFPQTKQPSTLSSKEKPCASLALKLAVGLGATLATVGVAALITGAVATALVLTSITTFGLAPAIALGVAGGLASAGIVLGATGAGVLGKSLFHLFHPKPKASYQSLEKNGENELTF